MNKIVVICGPTASGKTGYAHTLAKNNNGEIVNADSMQLYRQIPIITASPSSELKKEVPYHLYNFLDVDNEYSLAKYAKLAAKEIRSINSRNKLPILVGGTGLYINALINGFSHIPDIDLQIRLETRTLQQSLSSQDFHKMLSQVDNNIAQKLHPKDTQRIARAYEVYLQTGKSILYFQENNTKLLLDFTFEIKLLLPERSALYARCNQRLEEIFEDGAIEEIYNLKTKYKNLKTSAAKALGVQEIINYLDRKILKQEALELAQLRTRRYAKRQTTWFKNQIKNKVIIQ